MCHEGKTLDYESPALTAELQARTDFGLKHSISRVTNPESLALSSRCDWRQAGNRCFRITGKIAVV